MNAPLIVDAADLRFCAAIAGLGRTFSFEDHAVPRLESGALVSALDDERWRLDLAALVSMSRRS